MAKLEPEIPLRVVIAMPFTRFAAMAMVSLIIGGVNACGRWQTSSERHNDDKLLTEMRRAWEANAQAKLANAAGPPREQSLIEAASGPPRPQSLIEAAQGGDVKALEPFLASRVDRHTLNEALLMAARSEPLALGVDGQKEMDLVYAATARLLLQTGASIEARDKFRRTPLSYAAGNGETAVVKLLLERGADVEATDTEGVTPLIWAACNCPIISMPDTSDSVRLLLESGANIEAKDQFGGTALMNAAQWGRALIVEILLDKGANIEARNNKGNTALLISASGGGYPTAEAVEILLARRADIEARNNIGETALMLAASNGASEDMKIVKMLLDRGADIQVKDNKGSTALKLALEKGRTEIASLLRAAATKR